MNKLMRDKEKSNTSSPPHANTPPRDNAEGNETRNRSNDIKVALLAIALAITLAWDGQWLLSHIRAFLVRLREVSKNESSAVEREGSTSQATRHCQDLVEEDGIDDVIPESQAQLEDTWIELGSSIDES